MDTAARAQILCVDDEPNVLNALSRHLRRYFDVTTATSGSEGLQKLADSPTFAVVMSDMRMPVMDGSAFLMRVRQSYPSTTRVLLTGHADVNAAISAVNDGQIFRFLMKPCPPDTLVGALHEAVAQHNLITAERVLLEQTLHGSIRALTEVLSLVSPAAFGRATRAKQNAGGLAKQLAAPNAWEIEVAAMLSQLGCATLPPQTMDRLYRGLPLSEDENAMLARTPDITQSLVANIPRLEGVRAILAYQHKNFDGTGRPRDAIAGRDIPAGARILRVVVDYDVLETQGLDLQLALETLRGRKGVYDSAVLCAFAELRGAVVGSMHVREVDIPDLRPGMTLTEDVVTVQGALLIPRGQEVTPSLVARLRNLSSTSSVRLPVRIVLPMATNPGVPAATGASPTPASEPALLP